MTKLDLFKCLIKWGDLVPKRGGIRGGGGDGLLSYSVDNFCHHHNYYYIMLSWINHHCYFISSGTKHCFWRPSCPNSGMGIIWAMPKKKHSASRCYIHMWWYFYPFSISLMGPGNLYITTGSIKNSFSWFFSEREEGCCGIQIPLSSQSQSERSLP